MLLFYLNKLYRTLLLNYLSIMVKGSTKKYNSYEEILM